MKKYKFKIKQEVYDYINKIAEKISLYDKRFDDLNQCSGYRRFKELCLNEEDLQTELSRNTFHPAIKLPVIGIIKAVRNNLKTKNYE